MSNPLFQLGTAVAGLLISCSALAQPEQSTFQVISVSYSTIEDSGRYRLTPDGASSALPIDAELEYDSAAGAALAWGIEQNNSRFMLEYYRSASDIESAPFPTSDAVAERELQSIFYSGYWVPTIYWGLKGIVGAGVGYSQQTLNSSQGSLRERGFSYKISAGLEYAVVNNLSVYILAENVFLREVDDEIAVAAGETTAAFSANRALEDGEQTRLGMGINFRF